ncbi:MAG: alkaline phosphatase [Bacteroidetes bacterium]|nr:alkaline phosphatase [Bacteroidota bacterium]
MIAQICLFLSLLAAPETFLKPAHKPANARPKNIILLIGDGMGLTQLTAGLYSNQNHLEIERFPVSGLVKTHAHNRLITDSGAAATALACGCKTYNSAIGVYKNKKPCRTILEQARAQGLATGLIASCSITHATPAAFIAHVPDRADMEAIAPFFVQTPLDLLIGGGLNYFQQRKSDQRNLYQELNAMGYQLGNYTETSLDQFKPSGNKPFAWFSAAEEPESVQNGRNYLPLAARMAGPFLRQRSEKGFFLMLEGSQIDWACHKNNAPYAIKEMLDFDAAIGEILNFAAADGQTLVLLTADHETGGMAIKQGSELDSLNIAFASDQHTASLVPLFAFGPGADQFSGFFDNTDLFFIMQKLLGFPANPNPSKN